MKIQTTFLKQNNTYMKLKLPEVVACRNKTVCWEIAPTSCRDTLSLTLCQKRPHLTLNTCIGAIMDKKGSTASCTWMLAKSPEAEVVQFEGGLMLCSTQDTGELFIFRDEDLISKGLIGPSELPSIITPDQGDYLQFKGQLYQIKLSTIQVGYEIRVNMTLPSIDENLSGLTADGWVPVDKVPQLRDAPWAPPHHYTWWIVIAIIIFLILVTFLLIRHWKKVSHLQERVKKEILGWTTVQTNPPAYNPAEVRLHSLDANNLII